MNEGGLGAGDRPVERVAVALCTRDGEQHLPAQLASILSGSRLPDEVVIVDDASADRTMEIVAAFADSARERGVAVVIEQNPAALGVAANFERAIRMSTADIVMLCDQDDVWHEDRVAAVHAAYESEPGLLFLHGDAVIVDDVGDPDGTTLFGRLEVTARERSEVTAGRAFPVYLRRNLATGATSSFRRSLLDDALPFSQLWLHDEWLAIIAAARESIRIDGSPRIDYRIHGRNQVGAARPTLRNKVSRVTGADAERNVVLAVRARELAERLDVRGLPAAAAAAMAKAEFESARAELPRIRIGRIPRILGWLVGGDYRRWASRGRWDAVRDLLRR